MMFVGKYKRYSIVAGIDFYKYTNIASPRMNINKIKKFDLFYSVKTFL